MINSIGFLKAQWNNGYCDIDSLDYTRLNTYIDGRENMKSKLFADVDIIYVTTRFNIVLLLIISRFYDILTLDKISYGHLHVLILINLEDNHWVVARVDFRRKKISIYDSMKEFREDKTYGQLLKPLQVIFL